MTEEQTKAPETAEHREGRTAADLPEQAQPGADVAKIEDVEEAMRDVVDP